MSAWALSIACHILAQFPERDCKPQSPSCAHIISLKQGLLDEKKNVVIWFQEPWTDELISVKNKKKIAVLDLAVLSCGDHQ